MFLGNSGQAAVEYVFIVALALMLLVPASVAFYRFSADSRTTIAYSQVTSTAQRVVSLSEKLYSMGDAWETMDITLPDSVIGMKVYNDTTSELVVYFMTDASSEIVFFTRVPLFNSSSSDCTNGCTIDVHSGNTLLRLESDISGKVVLRLKD